MSAKELRILEIMAEEDCNEAVAEMLFNDEIMELYDTDDLDVAETMYEADNSAEI